MYITIYTSQLCVYTYSVYIDILYTYVYRQVDLRLGVVSNVSFGHHLQHSFFPSKHELRKKKPVKIFHTTE